MAEPRRPALSGMPSGEAVLPEAGPFDVPEALRYQDAGRLGVGGMGEVRAAVDLRLDREIALKVAVDPRAEEAMIREARLTARLDHPGVVAVHGAGRLPDGRAYYTMPVLRGRSLAEALAEAPDLAARLRLGRALLDATGAVAHAHAAGVLHRDLKPSNILIGAQGQAQVADWGLATALEPDGLSRAEPALGTPRYCSPEQARGARLSPASDVYSLGLILTELLGARGALESPELAAVAARATADEPSARYASAAQMAEDLLAWFEGRRVAAYRYSRRELLRRTAAAWRAPLWVAGVAALALAVISGAATRRVLAERDAARASEAQAAEARVAAEDSLSQALVAHALIAADQERWAAAEILAARALTLQESPDARGVLARFGGQIWPERRQDLPLPGCAQRVLSPGGRGLVCLDEAGVRFIQPGRATRSLEARVSAAAFAGEEGPLALRVAPDQILAWDGAQEPRSFQVYPPNASLHSGAGGQAVVLMAQGHEQILDLETGRVQAGPECARGLGPLQVSRAASGRVILTCAGPTGLAGQVIQAVEGAAPSLLLTLELEDGPSTALAVDPEERAVAVGTEAGAIVVQSLLRSEGRRLPPLQGPVGSLALRGDRLAVAGRRGDVRVWDWREGALLSQLPGEGAPVAWLDDDTLRVAGSSLEDWRVPAQQAPRRMALGAGLSAVAVSPDGERLGAVLGDGRLVVRDLATGQAVLDVKLHDSVAKDLAFSPEGDRVAAGAALDEGVRVFDLATGAEVALLPSWHVRRVAWTRGALYAANYDQELWRYGPAPQALAPGARVHDLEALAGGEGVLALLQGGRLLRYGAEGAARELTTLPTALAVAGSPTAVYALSSASLIALDPDGAARGRVALEGAPATELALSEDGRWLAVAHLDGVITLLRAEGLGVVARLRGHSQRVSALAFDAEGRRLVSGSWDGSARVWDLGALESDTGPLAEALEARWGRGLLELLRP